MRIVLIQILVALMLGSWSNSAAAQVEKSLELDNFDALILKGNYEMILEKGTTPSIRIAARTAQQMEKLEVMVEDDALRMTYSADQGKEWKDHPRIKVYLTYASLSSIDLEGKLLLEAMEPIETEHFDLDAEGYLKGDVAVVARSCKLDIQGYFRLKMAGETEEIDLDLEGMGSVKAQELVSEVVNVSMEGMASAYVNATKELYGSLEGMGKLRYAGNPPTKKINKEGLTIVSKK